MLRISSTNPKERLTLVFKPKASNKAREQQQPFPLAFSAGLTVYRGSVYCPSPPPSQLISRRPRVERARGHGHCFDHR